MDQWVCELCGYVYDPARGAEDIGPGVSFEDLPDDWECPDCLAAKERFVIACNATQIRKSPRQ